MKKHLLSFLFLIYCGHSFGQSWSVINSSDKFNFRLDNDNIVTATIWSDSVQLSGTDSIFFLNRIMCDTCVTIVGGPNQCDTCYGAKNRPQFFQRMVSVSPSGIVNFRDTGNIVINTLASLTDTWLFDSVQNISATVIAVATDSVFGAVDSIKTILLSNGDTLKLSQNFGVIQYPFHYGLNSYYRLVGIEGRNLGEQVPKFADFFNFNVGDMFEYEISDYTWECHMQDEIFKYTVINKQVNSNQYDFTVQGLKLIHDWTLDNLNCNTHDFYWTMGYNNFVLTFNDSSDHFANKYNRECILLQEMFGLGTIPCYNIDTSFDHLRTYIDTNGVLIKSFGISGLPGPWSSNYYFYLPIIGNYETLNNRGLDIAPFGYSSAYSNGLGRTSIAYGSCFEPWYEEHLTAYRKNGDTVGVFTPDSVLILGLVENTFQNQLKISPNPSSTFFSITFPHQTSGEISLTDVQGKILKGENISGEKAEMGVSEIENGLYFVLIKTNEGIFSKKVLVIH